MNLWRKHASPIDRCVEELEREIAKVQKHSRQITVRATHGLPLNVPAPSAQTRTPIVSVTSFIKDMLAPTKDRVPATYNTVPDLFDGAAEPLKELEADATLFAQKSELDLFTLGQKMSLQTTSPAKPVAPSPVTAPKPDEKLAQFLGAGSIKNYDRPLKRQQRAMRNRFFMWIGLSFVALWLFYFVIR